MGLMVFVDVIYNYFGLDGNYFVQYVVVFFCDDWQMFWGQVIDFCCGEVCEFFYENVLMWLFDYCVDGLCFDVVYVIFDSVFFVEMVCCLCGVVGFECYLYLVLENDDNCVSLLCQGYDVQWNDDGYYVLYVLFIGENDGYYQDYFELLCCLVCCLVEGFVYQGEVNCYGWLCGELSVDLVLDVFVLFL